MVWVHVFAHVRRAYEDVDQWFGELAKWVARKLTVASEPQEFVDSLLQFQHHLQRPYEPRHISHKLDQVRNWKAYLANIPQSIAGIAGPRAPHVFHFQRRESSALNVALEDNALRSNAMLPHSLGEGAKQTSANMPHRGFPLGHRVRGAGAGSDVIFQCADR